MLGNNSLHLSDKLVIIALKNLIPAQSQRPIKIAHIAAFAGISRRTVNTSLSRLRQREIIQTTRGRIGLPYQYLLHTKNVPRFDEDILVTLL